MIDVAQPWPGSIAERAANRLTHHWVTTEPEEQRECAHCATGEGYVAADWPCGQPPPRQLIDSSVTISRDHARLALDALGRRWAVLDQARLGTDRATDQQLIAAARLVDEVAESIRSQL